MVDGGSNIQLANWCTVSGITGAVKTNVETKKKDNCPCCGAEGFLFSKPFNHPEFKHFNDTGSGDGAVWIRSCIHKTGKMLTSYETWGEYNCNCQCSGED